MKNTSGQALSNVEAVGTWYTAADQFIIADDALTDFNPILPGQISSFKTISTYNPEMKLCRIAFKDISGRSIPATVPPAETSAG